MLELIRCTCGRPLGDIYDAFVARRADLVINANIKNNIDIDPKNMPREHASNLGDINLQQIFKDYYIDLICCRRILVASISQHQLYERSN